MVWYPKTRRIKAGHYEVCMGEEIVRVWRLAGSRSGWMAKPQGVLITRRGFGKKAKAIEWASEWLKEYA